MIIVEGPDGAGKTSLINTLVDRWGYPVAPRVVSKNTEAMIDLQAWVDENLDLGFQQVIFDRHRLISEPIYGPILRETTEPGFTELAWFGPRLQRFYDIKPIVIYCLPSLYTVRRNLAYDPDNTRVKDHISKVYRSYVNKIATDLVLAPNTTHVWDYENSLQIDGLPHWLYDVNQQIKERLA